MARVSKVDICMFCDKVPCICREAKKSTPKPRTPRKAESDPIEKSNTNSIPSSRRAGRSEGKKADVTAAMRSAAQVKHQGATAKEDHDIQDETADILADPEFVAAIQAVAPIMHITEQKRFEKILEVEPDHKARAAAWKRKFYHE